MIKILKNLFNRHFSGFHEFLMKFVKSYYTENTPIFKVVFYTISQVLVISLPFGATLHDFR